MEHLSRISKFVNSCSAMALFTFSNISTSSTEQWAGFVDFEGRIKEDWKRRVDDLGLRTTRAQPVAQKSFLLSYLFGQGTIAAFRPRRWKTLTGNSHQGNSPMREITEWATNGRGRREGSRPRPMLDFWKWRLRQGLSVTIWTKYKSAIRNCCLRARTLWNRRYPTTKRGPKTPRTRLQYRNQYDSPREGKNWWNVMVTKVEEVLQRQRLPKRTQNSTCMCLLSLSLCSLSAPFPSFMT